MYQFSNRSQMMSNCGMNKRGEGEGTRGQAKCVPNVLPTVWPLLWSVKFNLSCKTILTIICHKRLRPTNNNPDNFRLAFRPYSEDASFKTVLEDVLITLVIKTNEFLKRFSRDKKSQTIVDRKV